MARFDVYANPGAHASTTPYLLDVQSNLLDGLDSRMVIPLRSLDHFAKVKIPIRLMPVLSIMGKEYTDNCPFKTGNGYGDGRAIRLLAA